MGLLERAALLDRLADEHTTARDRGRAVLVGGEAGAGKTALVRAFADRIGPRVRVTVSHCDPLDTPRPLAGIADVAWALDGELAAAVDAAAPVHHVARGLLDAVERVGPVVIEDLQWADAATLDVVRLACRRIDQTKGLLIVTYRDDQIGRRDPLRVVLGEVGTIAAVTRLHVELLSVDAVAALAAGTGIDPVELHRRTQGNPFFVTEILAAGGDSIPVTVSDAVLARAARLSPSARELLDAVAVVPQTCEWSLLEVLVPNPGPRVEECCAAGLLVETELAGGGVQFRHELARRALESALPAVVRRQAHASVLAHLVAGAASDPARLAHHAEGAGDTAAIFVHSSAAGVAAAARGAHTEALKHLRAALGHAPTELAASDEARLSGTLAVEAYLSDLSGEAVAAQTRAVAAIARAGDDRAEGAALAMLSRMQWLDADLAGAFQSVERALDLLEPFGGGRELAMACSQRSALAMLSGENAGAVKWGERAIDLARGCGAVDVEAHALNNIGTSEWCFGRDRGRELLLRSLELALQADSVEDVGRAYANLSEQASLRMQPADALRFIEHGLAYSRSRSLTRSRVCLEARLADLATTEARYDEAGATLDFLLALPSISATTRIDVLVAVGLVRARRADPGVWEVIDEANVLAERFGEADRIDNARRAEVEAAFLEGDHERASDVAAASVGPAIAADDHGADELVWWAKRLGIDVDQPAFAREPFRRAAAGDHVGAGEQFAALGWRYHAALAFHDAGDTDSLRRALGILHEIGARPLARIVTRRLQASGVQSIARGPRPSTRAKAGLTARELEILELVSGNRSNREIAAELVVSVRTVEHHVSAVLAKLGASCRSDAVARADQLGLLQSG
jgi:DNA-binding CsgD family transcriptional regulator